MGAKSMLIAGPLRFGHYPYVKALSWQLVCIAYFSPFTNMMKIVRRHIKMDYCPLKYTSRDISQV